MSIRALDRSEYPELLLEIPQPPKQLRLRGNLPREGNKLLAIVGSRKFSPYGRDICEALIRGLKGHPVTIVSGLALGMDSIAHRSALQNGLQTIALPGSGVDNSVLHPRSHVGLAEEIVEAGGGILSEYDDLMPAGIWTFPQRNRIMAGMCHVTVVIEAGMKSGTLITSRLATEYNRDVGAVPGPLTSPSSDGPHMLLRLGAALIRDSGDILELLGLPRPNEQISIDMEDLNDDEKVFITILNDPCERDELIRKSKFDTSRANAVLSLLEIKGLISEELGLVRKTF
jgi:DNA processing protein